MEGEMGVEYSTH